MRDADEDRDTGPAETGGVLLRGPGALGLEGDTEGFRVRGQGAEGEGGVFADEEREVGRCGWEGVDRVGIAERGWGEGGEVGRGGGHVGGGLKVGRD